MHKLILIVFIIFVKSICFSQVEKYINGQLFVKVKNNSSIDLTFNAKTKSVSSPTPISTLISKYGITKISHAFILKDIDLQHTFLVEFNKTNTVENLISEFNKLDFIEYSEKVPLYRVIGFTPNDLRAEQWNLKKIQAEEAWGIFSKKRNIKLAIVDDAVLLTHEDIAPVIWTNPGEIPGNNIDDDGNGYIDDVHGWDVAADDDNPSPPSWATNSDFTHGTHCTGIAAAATNNNTGIASIGFNVQVIPVKCSYDLDNQYLQAAYLGVQYAIVAGADVISMSWGGGSYSRTYQNVFNVAYSKGIVCVAAAGNEDTDLSHYPSAYNHVISVGATDRYDIRASFSNYGSTVDVMAPGVNIFSSLAGLNDSYGYLSGTSMACPLVAGLSALMLMQDDHLKADELEACLKSSCDNIDAQNSEYIGEIGAGRINAYNALSCLQPVVSDFTCDYTKVCIGGKVQFSDNSKKSPKQWKWIFSGGNPATSLLQNPIVTYNLPGIYDVTLIAYNANGSDTLTRKQFISCANPTALISGTYTISKGYSANLRVDLTGNPPWNITYYDGNKNTTINNILNTPYYFSVSPAQTTTYTLASMNDNGCSGTVSGKSIITVENSSGGSTNFCTKIKKFYKISTSNGGIPLLNSSSSFGTSIAQIGDLNGDGIIDFVVGAHKDNDGGTQKGALWVLFMNKNGTIKNSQKISQTQGNFNGLMSTNGNFGESVAPIGDLDDDGIMDIAVGAYLDDRTGNDDGLLWILFMNSNGTVKSSQEIGEGLGNFNVTAISNSMGFGTAVTGLGDLDGDGIEDIAMSGSRSGAPCSSVWILFMNKNGTVKSYQEITQGIGGFTGSLVTSPNFGYSIDNIGDLDGDGITDIAVGSPFDDDGGTDKGAVYILFLNADGTVKSQQKISNTQGNFNALLDFQNWFGGEVSNLGDINGDSINDLGVGAWKDDDGGTDKGAFYILYLNKNGMVKNYKKISNTAGGFNDVLSIGGVFGTAVEGIGDFDGDGYKDIAVGAQYDPNGGPQNGAIWILNLMDTCSNIIIPPSCINTTSQQKISSTQGNFKGILANDDHFGVSVDSIGDVDGDGIPDIAVGSPNDQDGGQYSGAVWILFMNADRTVKSHQKISATQGGWSSGINSPDRFSEIAALGDLNNDGVPDIAVGCPNDDISGYNNGSIYILFLNKNGTVKSFKKITNGMNGFPALLSGGALFGTDISNIGDLDGDGVMDIVVGARGDDESGTDKGAVWILFLKNDGTVKSYQKINTVQSGFTGSVANGDLFGYTLSKIGDLDGDGIMDIAVGATLTSDGGLNCGAVWILFLNKNGTVKASQKISNTSGNLDFVIPTSSSFGSISNLGDINHDGVLDIAVTIANCSDGGPGRGSVYLLFLNKNGTVKGSKKISQTSGNFTAKINDNSMMGRGVALVNDYNHDGFPDLALGAYGDSDGGVNRGAVWIINLKDTCQNITPPPICIYTSTQQKISSTQGNFKGILQDGDLFGVSVDTIGDLNHDGVLDIAVGAAQDGDGGTYSGAEWILFMNSNGTVKSSQKISATQGNFNGVLAADDHFSEVAGIGDLNGDGVMDIAVGAPNDRSGGFDNGAIYVLFLNTNGTVKSYQKIGNGFGGLPIGSLSGSAWFGSDVEAIGDLDGDGVMDIAVGSRGSDYGGTNRGAVWILFMNKNGTVKSYQLITTGYAGFNGVLADYDYFGYSVNKAGDINKDGIMDIVVGAPFTNDGGTGRGAAWVLFMNKNGTVKSYQKISATQGNFISALHDNDVFGIGIANMGDLNNDGIPDIAVSSSADDDGGTDRGAFYLLFLNTDGTVKAYKKISSIQGGFKSILDNGDKLGRSLAPVGDFDKNGIPDLLAGAYGDDDGGSEHGAVWIINLSDTCQSITPPFTCHLTADFSANIVCIGDTTLFKDISVNKDTSAIVGWNWNFNDGTNIKGLQNPSHLFHLADTFSVQLIVTAGTSQVCSDTIVKKVIVLDTLTAITPADDTICIGDSIQLGPLQIICGAYPYRYQWSPATGLSDIYAANPYASPLVTTKYYVTVTDTLNVKTKDSITIYVDKSCCVSHAVIGATDSIYCLGNTVRLVNKSISKSPVQYNWYFGPDAAPTSFAGANSPLISFTKSGEFNVQLILSDICGIDSATVKVIVYPLPIVYDGRDTAFCLADTIQLGSNPISDFNYEWSPIKKLSQFNICNPKAYVDSSIIYYLKVTSRSSRCFSTDTVIITKLNNPVLKLGADTSICLGDSVTISSGTYFSYQWSNGDKTPSIIISPVVKTTYTLTVSSSDGCKAIDDKIIDVNPLPKANAGKDSTICNGSKYSLSAIGGQFYQWNIGSFNQVVPINPVKTTTYTVTVLNNFNCSNSDDIIVTVVQLPIVIIDKDDTICKGETVSLSVNGNGTYTWNTGQTSSFINVSPTITSTYSVSAKNYCGTAEDSTVIFVYPLPLANAGTDDTICEGQTVTLSAVGGIKYFWSTKQTVQTFNTQSLINTTFTVTVTDDNGCSALDEVQIFVHPQPNPFSMDDVMICLNETNTARLIINNHSEYHHNWYDASVGGNLIFTGNSFTANNILTPITYYIESISEYGCIDINRTPASIKIGVQPQANFFSSRDSVYAKEQIQLTDQSINAAKWHWFFGNNDEDTLSMNPIIIFNDTGLFHVMLVVESIDHCKDTSAFQMIKVKPISNIFIPSAFTPNNDGNNDILFVYGPVENMHIWIYNQWGVLIFKSDSQSYGWDGTYHGKDQPEGNYTYYFEGYNNSSHSKIIDKGLISLIR